MFVECSICRQEGNSFDGVGQCRWLELGVMRIIPRVRLSTAVVLMFLAGGWIWLNVQPRLSMEAIEFNSGHSTDGVWVPTYTLSPLEASKCYSRDGQSFVRQCAVFGFPMKIAQSPTWRVSDAASVDWAAVMFNAAVWLVVLWAVAWVSAMLERPRVEGKL